MASPDGPHSKIKKKTIYYYCFSAFISLMETGDEYKWKAYVLAVLLFLSGSIFGVTIHYSIMTRDRAGMRVRTVLTGAIYRKVKNTKLACRRNE